MGVAVDLFSEGEGDFIDVGEDDDTTVDDKEVVASFDPVWVVDSNRLDEGRVCIGMVA